jgi:polyferredoxin
MILAEESNPIWVKTLSMLVWVLIGALAVFLPVWAFITGKKSEIKASQIIGGVVGAGALALQVYFILSFVSGGFLFL